MQRQRSAKIIATLGPATVAKQKVRKLFEAGANAFCLDMCCGTRSDHLSWYQAVRNVEAEAGRPIAERNTGATRDEAGDVAIATYEGADALLLSAETAAGRHAAGAVGVVDRIAWRIESDPGYFSHLSGQGFIPGTHACTPAISAAIRTTTDLLPLAFTAAYTSSGSTGLCVAQARPSKVTDHRIATINVGGSDGVTGLGRAFGAHGSGGGCGGYRRTRASGGPTGWIH